MALRDRLGFRDRPVIGPGGRNVAGIEMPRTDQANGGDIFFLVLRACRFGKARERAGHDQGQPQLVPGLEQESIEQGPVFTGSIELLDQPVEARSRARRR